MAIKHTDSPWAWLRRGAAACALGVFTVAIGCGSGSDKPIPAASCSRCGSTAVTAEECTMLGTKNGCESSTTNMVDCNGTQVTGCVFENCDEPPDCAH